MIRRAKALLADITCPGLDFEAGKDAPGVYWLRVSCPSGADSVTGAPYPWHGRKWRLSPQMTDGEVVQTAFLALMTALEHEAREKFKFRGVAVFGPHFDIDALAAFASDPGNLKERD